MTRRGELEHTARRYRTMPPRHRAKATIRIGRHSRFTARVDVTSTGLLAVGALVSSILLSTAVLVRVSVREGAEAKAIQH